jgi:hypothetical protein
MLFNSVEFLFLYLPVLLLASILFNYLVGRTLVLGLGLLSLTRPSEFLTHKINRTLTPINPYSEALEMM